MTQRLGGVQPHVPRSNRHPHAFHASHTLPAHLLFCEAQPFRRVILHLSLLGTYRRHLSKRFLQEYLESSTSRNESAMDSLCGPSNALQNAQKHTSVDRTLQQDRLISRQPPTQVSRSPGSQEVLSITYSIYRDFDRKARKASWTLSLPHLRPAAGCLICQFSRILLNSEGQLNYQPLLTRTLAGLMISKISTSPDRRRHNYNIRHKAHRDFKRKEGGMKSL